MKKIFFTVNLIFFFVLFFNPSFSQNEINLPNISSLYNPAKTTLHPQYRIYHKTNENSTIYSYFYLPELNFIRLYDNTFEGKLKVKYIFYESLERKNILDSVSKIIKFQKTNIRQAVTTYYDIEVPTNECHLVIITKDIYNNKKSINIIHINKTETSEQNFLLVDSETLKPIFTNYLELGKSYKIKHNEDIDSIFVEMYKPDTLTFYSPFTGLKANFEPELDSTFYINSFADFKIEKQGIYKFSNQENGASVSFVCFNKNYPETTNSSEMLIPLKCLCTIKEYRDYESQINKKIAVDDFWLSTCEDENTAKGLIKIYYNRVLFSNLNFSTTREGWKTDRGMIYMIFGPAEILFKGDNFEEWIYSDAFSGKKISFIFDQKPTVFSTNIFTLRKGVSSSVHWKNAVQSWREGTLYIY